MAPDSGRLGSSSARLTVSNEHNGGNHSPSRRRLGSLGARLTRRVVVVGRHRRILRVEATRKQLHQRGILRLHHVARNTLERGSSYPWLVKPVCVQTSHPTVRSANQLHGYQADALGASKAHQMRVLGGPLRNSSV